MKQVKLAGIAMGVLFALLAMAASASAAFTLPDVSVTLTGGTYPLHSNGTNTGKTQLGSSSGYTLVGVGVTLLLTSTELSSLGTFNTDFVNVETPANKSKCHTTGDAEGVVLVEGTYHVVPLTASAVGILLLPKNIEITCGTLTTKVLGDLIASVNAGSEGTELTSFGGVLEGTKGKQNITEYINDTGSKVKVKLEVDAGAEYVSADENVVGETKLEVLGGQMLVITGR